MHKVLIERITGVAFVGEARTDSQIKNKVLNGEIQLVFTTPESIIANSPERCYIHLVIKGN